MALSFALVHGLSSTRRDTNSAGEGEPLGGYVPGVAVTAVFTCEHHVLQLFSPAMDLGWTTVLYIALFIGLTQRMRAHRTGSKFMVAMIVAAAGELSHVHAPRFSR